MKNEWSSNPNVGRKERPKVSKKSTLSEDNVEEVDSDEDEEKEKHVVRQDMSSGHYDFDGENHTYTDPKDGTIYFWDKDKNAWFPKVGFCLIAFAYAF